APERPVISARPTPPNKMNVTVKKVALIAEAVALAWLAETGNAAIEPMTAVATPMTPAHSAGTRQTRASKTMTIGASAIANDHVAPGSITPTSILGIETSAVPLRPTGRQPDWRRRPLPCPESAVVRARLGSAAQTSGARRW